MKSRFNFSGGSLVDFFQVDEKNLIGIEDKILVYVTDKKKELFNKVLNIGDWEQEHKEKYPIGLDPTSELSFEKSSAYFKAVFSYLEIVGKSIEMPSSSYIFEAIETIIEDEHIKKYFYAKLSPSAAAHKALDEASHSLCKAALFLPTGICLDLVKVLM